MTSSALKALTATTGNRKDTWNTPNDIVEDIISFFGGVIDLDPCSNDKENPNVPANTLYTEDDDGLAHPWVADTVFMNHPYSNSKQWIPYAAEQYECGNAKELILLIKLDISTKWWRSIANYSWCAVNKRLRFGDAKSAAPFQSAIIYLGKDVARFKKTFSKYGTIYSPV
jgi:phage N-6-adenine-methyltransferase